MNSQYSQFVYSDTPTPKFSDQPHIVFSTPGLGHVVQDHILFVPIRTYERSVKCIEKQLDTTAKGGYNHNLPLIASSLTSKKRSQKGYGKKRPTLEPSFDDKQLEDALTHPIKVN